ncbi:MarR family winged helix-turn-helix transcriptional regulator [Saccharothrix australiensis]|uniref:DNA-binding MarR family transcriptional regulator n=1 Tax=Saccharothrix australiensis TaxID=2072 RepID=A0A495VWP3_9PSEU|nr:MarR family transcriptional regulator [Saccharothrix australiensis]RKT53147.1 DNA-binding MarR family transcriptional regulator [Saccharothrix australiensis]
MTTDPGTEWGDVLTDVVMRTFRLYGGFLEAAEVLTKPVGLTAAWWQVLGAVLRRPLPVSGIAREMGLTRQSVQRIADLLVDRGLAEYLPNPAHRRAKLFRPTEAGQAAVAGLEQAQRAWVERISAQVDPDELRTTLAVMERLIAALDADAGRPVAGPPGGRPGDRRAPAESEPERS